MFRHSTQDTRWAGSIGSQGPQCGFPPWCLLSSGSQSGPSHSVQSLLSGGLPEAVYSEQFCQRHWFITCQGWTALGGGEQGRQELAGLRCLTGSYTRSGLGCPSEADALPQQLARQNEGTFFYRKSLKLPEAVLKNKDHECPNPTPCLPRSQGCFGCFLCCYKICESYSLILTLQFFLIISLWPRPFVCKRDTSFFTE